MGCLRRKGKCDSCEHEVRGIGRGRNSEEMLEQWADRISLIACDWILGLVSHRCEMNTLKWNSSTAIGSSFQLSSISCRILQSHLRRKLSSTERGNRGTQPPRALASPPPSRPHHPTPLIYTNLTSHANCRIGVDHSVAIALANSECAE